MEHENPSRMVFSVGMKKTAEYLPVNHNRVPRCLERDGWWLLGSDKQVCTTLDIKNAFKSLGKGRAGAYSSKTTDDQQHGLSAEREGQKHAAYSHSR